MSRIDDIKKQKEKENRDNYGELYDNPESDDDVDEAYEKVVGHKPKPGESIADEVTEAERSRRGIMPHEKKDDK